MPTKELLLYDHPVSSYAQKVRIYLREKGVTFKAVLPEVLKTGKSDTVFTKANPRLEVPTLIVEDEDLAIFDSTIIIEYLEEKYPSPALVPPDPASRAKARMIEEICDTHYEAVNWGIGEIEFFDRAPTEELKRKLLAKGTSQTKTLQTWLTEQLGGKPYFNGETFGSADICVAPIVNRSKWYGVGPEPSSSLGQWLERIQQRDSIKITFAEFDEHAPKMKNLAGIFKSGERKREYRDHRLEWMIKSGGVNVVLDGLRDGNIRFSWPED